MDHIKECPVCKKIISTDEDMVVCPKCGAPYHRECYKKIGHCMFEDLHETGKPYNYNDKSYEEPDNSINEKQCPRCLSKNTKSSLFCSHCGYPLVQDKNNDYPFQGSINGIPFIFNPLESINLNEKINDISIKDISNFIGSNSFYYITEFKRIHNRKKRRFNFCAFLFSGAWFVYRKMYKIGTILTILFLSLIIASTFIKFNYTKDIISDLLYASGISSSSNISPDNINVFMENFNNLEITKKILLFAPTAISIINFIIMIISGIIANKVYFKDCITKIKKIKYMCENNKEEYNNKLKEMGGINYQATLFIAICYIIVEYLPRFLIQ